MNKTKSKRKYTELVGIRFGKKQRAKLQQMADDQGLKLSSYIRNITIREMNKVL